MVQQLLHDISVQSQRPEMLDRTAELGILVQMKDGKKKGEEQDTEEAGEEVLMSPASATPSPRSNSTGCHAPACVVVAEST